MGGIVTTKERIKNIQTRLGLEADGLIGPVTLTAIERLLDQQLGVAEQLDRMTCSLVGLEAMVRHEISSDAYYYRFLKHPVWPGGASGVTIGIGYDLGYHSPAQFRRDWQGRLFDDDLAVLEKYCRLRGDEAKPKVALQSVKQVTVELADAKQVFYRSSLPAHAEKCIKAYPGVTGLPADAQAALLSLTYNRGTRKSGSRRREMEAIEPLVQAGDLAGIAEQILAMKRLWVDAGLDGLLKRRDDEAQLVLGADREYEPEELVTI